MSVDPYTGKIIKPVTILENGVDCLPKFAPSRSSHKPKAEHPLDRTSTGQTIGAKKASVHDVPTTYRPTSQAFSNGFSIGESTNKRTIMFKDNGLNCAMTRSKVHEKLDWHV